MQRDQQHFPQAVEILEEIWADDWSNHHDTEQKRDNSALFTLNETVLSSLRSTTHESSGQIWSSGRHSAWLRSTAINSSSGRNSSTDFNLPRNKPRSAAGRQPTCYPFQPETTAVGTFGVRVEASPTPSLNSRITSSSGIATARRIRRWGASLTIRFTMTFVPRPISFIFEFYEMDDPPLLPTRVERARPIPIRSPRPSLPPHSFKAIIEGDWQGDWESIWAVRTHKSTNEEKVNALSRNFLLDTTVNPTKVDSRKFKPAAVVWVGDTALVARIPRPGSQAPTEERRELHPEYVDGLAKKSGEFGS
ncbi:hypothetical protein B0H21DRAFT_710586 [Amylocystis lapponica]|nr:hypothetical protein B0H21DRAFT_710586 [Amylocystis lapponica]